MVRVGVDVGGTFTDFVFFDEESGRLWTHKESTTPRRPVVGIISGLSSNIDEFNTIDTLIHATTIGTNMFLGQMGIEPPKAVLFTNKGFRDIIEIGRQNRPSLYDLNYEKPKPLIPREYRVGVAGRIDAEGNIIEELDVKDLAERARRFCREEGVKVFIVSFLHSYANNTHESTAKEVIARECPGSIVVTGSEIDPEPMEFERTSTAVVNGLLKPVLSKYLEELDEELRRRGFKGLLLIMQSSGGVSSIREALERPAAFIESGPSAGAVAVAHLSRILGIDKALGFDMGGTTAKASSIIGGEPEVVEEYEVGGKVHMGRLVRGSGYPVRFPHIDLAEVSAGGGTIAWIDPGGGLRVGPISAGADPGPACYGKGSMEPTITDANLVLGRLPTQLAGGLRLRVDLAERAIREKIARPLGIDLVEAAWSIIGLANTVMARALRLVSVERGHDPREFALFAFGGAGPLHAVEIGRDIGVSKIIIPPYAGVFSALGLLVADYKHSLHRAIVKKAGEVTEDVLEEVFRGLEAEANRILEAEGVPVERRKMLRYVDVKYWGQAYTLRVPYRDSIRRLVEDFERLHEARYGFSSPGEEVELVVARVDAIGVTEKPVIKAVSEGRGGAVGERDVFFEGGWYRAPVYRREGLGVGSVVEGPSIVEASDTTIVVPPGYRGVVDELGDLVIVG
ncbi:MAG: hydantoinase/oxoprolinase family protein [Desulfurococcales archaeon]|nr:hydantoinase/oxoprolinase family protein [Desulfurococcales archaeon]